LEYGLFCYYFLLLSYAFGEALFNKTDPRILRGRPFDTTTSPIPRTRQLRSDTARRSSTLSKKLPPTDNAQQVLHDSITVKSRASSQSPSHRARKNSRDGLALEKPLSTNGVHSSAISHDAPTTPRRGRSAKESEELNVERTSVSAASSERAHDQAPAWNGDSDASRRELLPEDVSEKERIRKKVESQPGSPGVDPSKTQTEHHHKAATVHLPPKDVQERHLREMDRNMAKEARRQEEEDKTAALSIKTSRVEGSRAGEPLSSPGSTVAQSINTPALHDASTDTSPDNEGAQYGAEHRRKATSPLATATAALVEQVEAHAELAKANEVRREHQQSSPVTADAQIRLEVEQAAAASGNTPKATADGDLSGQDQSELTRQATEVVQDSMEDEDDEVVGVPTPEDVTPANATLSDEQEDAQKMDVDPADPPTQSTDLGPAEARESSAVTTETGATELATAETPSTNTRPSLVPERMTTRVSSGAMRHKSVSEILGETPKPITASGLKRGSTDASSGANSKSASRSSTPQSSRLKSFVERSKEKERSKLTTVMFAKQQQKSHSQTKALVPTVPHAKADGLEHYMTPFFTQQIIRNSKGTAPLHSLLASAHKTLTTANSFVPILDHQAYKIVERVIQLQHQNKWSLRQPERAKEPNRPTTHWDVLLKEMKWMRTDFREEKKWKIAVARNLAHACTEWVSADEEDRKLLQVNARSPPKSSDTAPIAEDVEMVDGTPLDQPTPDLEASTDNNSPADDSEDEGYVDLVPPTGIFALDDDDVVFGLRKTAATDKLLQELPLYSAGLQVPDSALPTSKVSPDAHWKRPAVAVSKFVEGKLELLEPGPPIKKSRYDYEEEDEDEVVVFGAETSHPPLPPQSTEVALFTPENKAMRDRIHAGHQFRPPSEYPMPMQSFFECRNSSQWTWAEDDELKNLVREYTYNWSLISSMLQSRSMFSSGAERRTPWECFERWIHLEGLPADMQKTQYFRAYNARLEAANRTVQQQALQAPSQPTAPGAPAPPIRRRTTSSVRVERRRNQKHLTLVDAMRKLAKKRETAAQKAQHAANIAHMRTKPTDNAATRPTIQTPQYFSRVKHERDLQMQERLQQIQLRQEQVRRVSPAVNMSNHSPSNTSQAQQMQQRNPQQTPQQQAQQGRPTNPNIPNMHGGLPANQNQLAVPGQNRPHSAMPPPNAVGGPGSMPNGYGGMPQMGMKNMPQAPMGAMPGQGHLPQPNPPPNLRMAAQQIANQQRQQVAMQHFPPQHPGQGAQAHNSPPANMRNMNGIGQQNFMQNGNQAAMMQAFNPSTNGVSTPPATGSPIPGATGSPRVGSGIPQPPTADMARVHIMRNENHLRAQNPQLTPDQIKRMATDMYAKQVAAQRSQLSQSAMHAAAGGSASPAPGMPNGVNGMAPGSHSSPQAYAQQMMRQQQAQQQRAQQIAGSGGAGASGPSQGLARHPSGQGQPPGPPQGQSQSQPQGQSQAQGQPLPQNRPPSQGQPPAQTSQPGQQPQTQPQTQTQNPAPARPPSQPQNQPQSQPHPQPQGQTQAQGQQASK
jgi:chromatin modification-related protein VID21